MGLTKSEALVELLKQVAPAMPCVSFVLHNRTKHLALKFDDTQFVAKRDLDDHTYATNLYDLLKPFLEENKD